MSRVFSYVLVVCVWASPASAQPLTIAAAIDEAVQHNLSLLAARSSLTIADAQMVSARLRPNPVASVSADHLDLLGTGFDETNNGGPPEMAVRVDLPLERGGKRDARIAVAMAARSGAEAQFADAVRTLRQDVTLACIDVMAAHALRALMADTLRTYEELARLNKARVVAGSIPGFEATRSEVAMLQFRATVVRADLDIAKATAQLRTLLGRPPEAPLEIADALAIAGGEPAADDLAGVESLALRSRPDLLALQLVQARSVADLRLQEALGRVDYTVGAEYRRQQGISGRSNSLGFFFSTPLPLLNRNQGEIARAGAERDQASQLIAARRAQVIADVRSAHHDYTVTRELVAGIERDLLAPAGRARDISSYTYQAGGATLLELLDAQRAFNETMQTYVDAQANLRRAIARLNAAAGTEVVR
jgi:cobalt-zinc-cadmium efflux system outer membrane protein